MFNLKKIESMKELKRLKLVQLSKDELKSKEMNILKGGINNCCGCGYGYPNAVANDAAGYGSSIGGGASSCSAGSAGMTIKCSDL